MSKPQNQQSPGPDDENSDSGGGFASIERAFLRLTFWQTLLSLAGVFTGGVALYAALGESQAVRQQTAATVWPYVQLMVRDHLREDQAEFALDMNNVGVGPARMRDMQLLIDGRAHGDWRSVLASLLPDRKVDDLRYGRSDVSRRVLAPGESLTFFQTNEPLVVEALQEAVFGARVTLSYCYCSIFDDCWLAEIKAVGGPEPAAVDQCPAFGETRFGN